MENKDNIIEITKNKSFSRVEDTTFVTSKKSQRVTNPIAAKFVKYFGLTKGKFSIKDILR